MKGGCEHGGGDAAPRIPPGCGRQRDARELWQPQPQPGFGLHFSSSPYCLGGREAVKTKLFRKEKKEEKEEEEEKKKGILAGGITRFPSAAATAPPEPRAAALQGVGLPDTPGRRNENKALFPLSSFQPGLRVEAESRRGLLRTLGSAVSAGGSVRSCPIGPIRAHGCRRAG